MMQQLLPFLAPAGRLPRPATARVLAAAGLALVAALPAAAQTVGGLQPNEPVPTVADNDDLEEASTGVAGLSGFPGRGLHLRANVATRYEDNLSRRLVKDDGLRVRPTATASYGLGAGRFGLYASGTYGRDFVYGNSLLQSADRQRFGAGLAGQLSRCNVDAGGSYLRNLVQTTDVVQFGGIQQRTAQAGAAVACRIGGALSVNASATYADVALIRGGGTDAFDSERWTYTAGIALARPALGRITLDGSIADVTFNGRFVVTPTGQQEDGLLQRSIRLGWAREFGSRLTLAVGGAYNDTGPKSDGTQVIIDGIPQVANRSSFNGAGYDAALTFRLSPRLTLNAKASRSVRGNNFIGSLFTVVDGLQLGAVFKMSRNITLAAGWDRMDSQFRSSVATALEPVPRVSDQFDRYFGTVSTRIGRRLRLALDVSHNQRRSNPAVFNFDSTGVGLTLGLDLGKQ